jgi:hypothetical protein
MEEIYLKDIEKISKVLENARMTETGEEVSKLSYKGSTIVVPTIYLNRLVPSYGNERTIESLTGIKLGLAVNTAKGASTYSQLSQTSDGFYNLEKPQRLAKDELSQTGEKKTNYYKPIIPEKPKRRFD